MWLFPHVWASLIVKNQPAMQETWVRLLGQEDSLEKGMTIHFSILTGRLSQMEAPGGLQSMWSQSDTTEQLILSLSHMSGRL